MPRKPLPVGPSRLSQILSRFQREPIPKLTALRSLRLTYAIRNDHFGARHFVKEDLPRIAYANPTLKIVLDRKEKKVQDTLVPEMHLEFRDGSQCKIDMEKKWSSTIFTELLEAHSSRGKEAGSMTSAAKEQHGLALETGSKWASSRNVASSA